MSSSRSAGHHRERQERLRPVHVNSDQLSADFERGLPRSWTAGVNALGLDGDDAQASSTPGRISSEVLRQADDVSFA